MVRRMVARIRGSVSQRPHVPSHMSRTGLVAGLLLGLCLCLPVSAWSVGGDISWQYDSVALNKQEAKATAVDSQGNLVIVGYSAGAGNDYLVVKLKADGSGSLWTAGYDATGGGDVATAVVIDSNDDVIVTGYVWDGATYNDIYTVKYAAADGAVLWQHTFDGTGSGNDYATAITVDSINNVYVGGYMQDSNGKDSFIVLKYGPINGPNPDGTPLWQAGYDGGVNGHDRITAITAGIDGIAVTGQSQNATPDFDCLTIKYNFAGSEIWQRRYSDSGDGKGLALAMDAAGNVIMAGYVSNGSDRDFYVIEYAADDSPAKWVKIYDSGYDDEAADLWLDAAGDVYVVGTHASLMTGQDIYFARFDGVSGVEVWNGSYNSSNGDNDHGLFIVGDDNGELFIAGYNNDSAGGFDDFLTLKLTRAAGTLLWAREYDGAGKNDRSVGAGLAPDGNLLIGGWSDRWTAGSSDYDFYALKYESGALNQPTALTAAAVTDTQIDLTWVDNSTTEENFVVERKIGALGSYAAVAALAADSVSYSDSGLTADTRYYYRVMAYNAATGNSPYSDEANAKTTIVSYAAPALQFQFGGAAAGDDYAQAIAAGADNHPVVTGFITGGATGFDYYTVKLDRADLSEQWHTLYNDGDNEGDVAAAITVDSSNRVVVTGYSSLYGGGAGNTNDVYTIGYPADGSVEAWTDQYNGPAGDDDRSSAVSSAIDGSDNTVVVGYGKNASFNDDIYVLKYRSDGTREWAATPYDGGGDDYPAAAAFDANGDILVGGNTGNGSNRDYFVAKYDGSTGAQLWVKTFNGPGNGDDYINALAVDAAGDLYVTGYSANAAGNGDIYTIKYAGSDGTLLWEHADNGPGNAYDVGDAVQFDPVDGDILVGGTINIGPGNNDYRLLRYAADGTLVWQKTLDRPGSDEALVAMAIDRSGTVCLTGTTDAGGNDDVLTVKYDSDGVIIGASIYNGSADRDDAPAAIAGNAYGEIFVTGFTTNAVGNTDYMVFLADGKTMQSPTPFTAVQLYTQVDLTWTDNSLDESGFRLERKVGNCSSANPWTALFTAAAGETGYSNTDLSIGSTFCYRIQSFNGSGESSRWAELEVTTADPVAPSGLTTTVLNTTDIQLDWTDNTGNEDGFIVERCLGSGCDFSTVDTQLAVADAVTFTDVRACAGQTYSYRLKSYRSNEWTTGYSNPAVDQTTDSPVAATDFTVNLISEQQVDLNWTDNSTDETGFKIERCTGSGCSNFVEVGDVAADEVNYSDTGLQYNTLYRYRVTPYKTSACTVPAAYTPILDVTSTPPAPASVSAVAVTSTQVNLSWVDGTAAEDGFKIERCQGSACSNFTQIAVVAADQTRFVDDTICAGVAYRYRIRAFSGTLWDSPYSSIVAVTAGSPQAPGSFSVTALSEAGIALDWSMTGYDLNGYQVSRCAGAACTPTAQAADIPSGRVLALSMEEAVWDGTADEVKDNSGYGNHGTSHNGAVTVADGKYNWGGDFVDPDGYITTPLLLDQSSSSAGATFEAWVYPYSSDNSRRMIISTENGGYDWSLGRYGTSWRIYNGTNYWSVGSVTPDVWQHLLVVFEPGVGVRFYLNGTRYSSPTIGYDSSSNPVNIGRRANGNYYFDGRIDEVMVYARALSDAEVQARYNSGNTAAGTLAGQYRDSGLSPATTYGYQLTSYRADDCAGSSPAKSSPTAVLYATTLSPPPPTGFSATTVNSTQIDLAWTDNTASETAFVIERCPGSGTACDEDAEFSLLTTTAADAVSYADQSVCYGQTYTYRVAAEKTDGPVWQTSWAADDNATTLTVATPVDFAATAASEVQIDLSWTDNLTDEDSYTIEKCTGSGTACDQDSEFSALVSFDNRQVLTEATLWMKMDEASWGTVYNSVAGGNNGIRYGNAAPVDDAERGRVGQFDGNGDYIMISNYAGISPSTAMTLSIWAKSATASWNSTTFLMSKRNSYLIGPSGTGGMQFWIFAGGTWRQLIVADLGIDISRWHQYTGTYDGTDLILYVDGQEVDRLAYSGSVTQETGQLMLGRDDGYSRYLNGWLDDALVFTRALNGTEVDSLYRNTGGTLYHDQGLSPSTTYSYRLRSSKTAACPWITAWEVRSATTLDPPPPSDFSVTATTTTSIDIDWTDNSGSETGYNLERCLGSGTACDEDLEFSTLDGALAPDTSTYTDATVCEGGTYSYRVRAEKSDGPIWQTSWAGPLSATPPLKVAPSGLTAGWVSEVQIDLVWTDNSSDESGFKIERCAGAGCSSFVEIGSAAADAETYQDDQLDPGVSYSYRIKAFKTAGCPWETAYTGTVSETTSVIVPSGLTASPVNTTQIDLAWTDNAATETSTIIERCTGSGCNSFAVHDEIGGNLTRYADVDACYGTTYNYRLKIKNEGLAGGGCWTRRAPLNFTGFSAGAITRLTVPYDADMRTDFGDLRFYDEDGKRQLAYFIESKTDGVTATVQLKLGKNQNVSMYYGNAAAGDVGNEDELLLFRDNFVGTLIDTGKWVEIDPDNSISQNGDLLLNDVSDSWSKALISKATFSRVVGREMYVRLTIAADTAGNNYFMAGWEQNQTSNAGYNQLIHGLYWSNYIFNTFEKGGSKGGAGGYAASTGYEMKIVLKSDGARYYVKGGAYTDWTLVKDNSNYSDAVMRIAFTQNSHQAKIHEVKVREALTDTGASLGAEETSTCYAFINTWEQGYSNQSEATTGSPAAPSGLVVTAITDTQFDLSWTDNTDAESGFRIERCSGSGCSNFAQIDTLGTDETSYTDTTAPPSTESSYRVRAFKNSSCPWSSGYSNIAGDLSFPAASTSLIATALNSRMIKLDWDDNASDEDGYEVEVQAWNGRFTKIADLPADSVSYVDTMSIQPETEYRYRIRPYRSLDIAPYSNEAAVTTPAYVAGDGTCPP